jgi:restriction endonuclease S subunit
METRLTPLGEAPLEIIDGDRGNNYPNKEEFRSTGYCLFLNTSNVAKDGFNFAELDFVTRERDLLLRKGKLKRNDCVLTTRGTVGNTAFFGPAVKYENIRINSGMVIVRPDANLLDPYYLYCYLVTIQVKKIVPRREKRLVLW